MKKAILPLLLLLHFTTAAQTHQDIKNSCMLQQYSKAKTDIDKAMLDAAFTAIPEAYILKATVYGTLAADAVSSNPSQAESLATEGHAAFIKYREKDTGMQLLNDALYKNAPLNLYSAYYSSGYTDYSQKQWNAALNKISKAVSYSDLLIQKKIVTTLLDTNILVLAGITAENCGKKDEAAVYYSRLADAQITGEGFESVYRYLAAYYFGKNNMLLFEKYKATGRVLYPASDYFKFDKVDFAVGLSPLFTDKFISVENILTAEPENFKALTVLGELIYDELTNSYAKNMEPAKAPTLEQKMLAGFKKAVNLKPDYISNYLFMGDYFINKAVYLNTLLKATTTDAEKQKSLTTAYGTALEAAKEPYEKAVKIYTERSSINRNDKAQYKKALSYLTDIAAYKKQKSTPGSAAFIQWDAEEKKWAALSQAVQ